MELSDDDEFEPLFDYTRIQPRSAVFLDDDSPVPGLCSKKQKIADAKLKEQKESSNVSVNVINCDDKEDEEDWLLPPPKSLDVPSKIQENSTLKALRLQKQELASLAQSTDDIVRAAQETVRKDLKTSPQSSPRSVAKKPPEPAHERETIVVTIQGKDGSRQVRVNMDDKFERICARYAQKENLDIKNLVFIFDGDKIGLAATPDSLGMEENDIIEVHVKSK